MKPILLLVAATLAPLVSPACGNDEKSGPTSHLVDPSTPPGHTLAGTWEYTGQNFAARMTANITPTVNDPAGETAGTWQASEDMLTMVIAGEAYAPDLRDKQQRNAETLHAHRERQSPHAGRGRRRP